MRAQFVYRKQAIYPIFYLQGEKGFKGDTGPMGLPVSCSHQIYSFSLLSFLISRKILSQHKT